ncbi:MAG: hypothetical protein A2147_10890 [Chloroflexi bacterium RBG_16_57_8]|nr:MAG: hypothetical protein A2147_10890 [Chloroflexi bacterium RBG_16_57_8]
MASEKEELMSVRDAAKQCGKNAETVRRWVWSGRLPAEKLGNQLFVKRSDLAPFCREPAVEYKAGPRADFLDRAIALQNRLKARGVEPIDSAELIRRMREERTDQLGKSLH